MIYPSGVEAWHGLPITGHWQSGNGSKGGKPSEAALRRQLNDIKVVQFPWMLDITKNAPQQTIKDLGAAFKRFFAGQGHYPRFK